MDVDYNCGKSIADLPISDPIHAPCSDMEGCTNFDPQLTEKSLIRVQRRLKRLKQINASKKKSTSKRLVSVDGDMHLNPFHNPELVKVSS